jgi:hypothetical protein
MKSVSNEFSRAKNDLHFVRNQRVFDGHRLGHLAFSDRLAHSPSCARIR